MSQWLYLHTALGKGYLAPFPYSPAWVITSGIPADMVTSMRTAENEFHVVHERALVEDRKKLAELERKSKLLRASGGLAPQEQAELEALREQLSKPVFVNYRDWTADRATMVELLSKSKYRAMSFVDELGIRAHGYTVNKFLAARHIASDLALLSLAGDQSSDSVLIRSSATGGANMLSVRGMDTPRFNLITMTSPHAAEKIASRLKEAAPCRGITVVLPALPGDHLQVSAAQISKVISKVYAISDPERRIIISMSPAWGDFMQMRAEDVAKSDAALNTLRKSLTSVQTMVRTIARAIITRRIFMEEDRIPLPSETTHPVTIALTDEDLALAKEWLVQMSPDVFGFKHLLTRASNMATAKEAWEDGLPVEQVIEAKAALIDLIRNSPHAMVSAREATRAQGITERSLEAAIAYSPDTFKVLENVAIPGSKRASKRVIVLADGWETHHTAVGDGDSFGPGSDLSPEIVDGLYREWLETAEQNMEAGGRPAVAVNAISEVLKPALLAVQKRFWQTTTLVPSGEPPEPGAPRPMELWFRFNRARKDMCAWKHCYREWKLYEKWKDKDEEAAERRINLGMTSTSDPSSTTLSP